jgi:indole-3-glycerol phosphate synthase
MTILEKIIHSKRLGVKSQQKNIPLKLLEKMPFIHRNCFSLKDSIVEKNGIIAEFKRKSPSKGSINEHSLVENVTKLYEKSGVSGLSVLTDESFFGGSSKDLLQARKHTKIPILRKDFIISEYQIIEAKTLGADVILLIASVLTKTEVKNFTALAHQLGMEVLFEIHTLEELEKHIPEIGLVGINNRNLKTFEVDFENSIKLCQELPKLTLKIAESGISDFKNIIRLKKYGFNGFLIGENFMKTENPGLACQQFVQQLKEFSNE